MKKISTTQPPLRPLCQLIQAATGARARDCAQIENIMHDEIFHSTLDWQTREQLNDAARQAYALVNENREQYEMRQSDSTAIFRQMKTVSVAN